jgi:hypothetical protein
MHIPFSDSSHQPEEGGAANGFCGGQSTLRLSLLSYCTFKIIRKAWYHENGKKEKSVSKFESLKSLIFRKESGLC